MEQTPCKSVLLYPHVPTVVMGIRMGKQSVALLKPWTNTVEVGESLHCKDPLGQQLNSSRFNLYTTTPISNTTNTLVGPKQDVCKKGAIMEIEE